MLSRTAKLKLGLTYWVGAAAVFGIIGWSTLTVVDMRNDLSKAEKDRAALSQQVKDLGGTPIVGPRGNTGASGRDGRDGDTGAPGKAGASGRDGSTGPTGANGANGKNGAAGIAGRDGVAGRDGTDGRDGVDGRDGRDGVDGAKGDKGDPGPTCPDGYTLDYVNFGFTKSGLVCMKNETAGG